MKNAERRRQLMSEAEEIQTKAAADGGRELSDEELGALNARMDEIEKIDAEAAAQESTRAALARLAAAGERGSRPAPSGPRAPLGGEDVEAELARQAARAAAVASVACPDPRFGYRSLGEFGAAVMDRFTPGAVLSRADQGRFAAIAEYEGRLRAAQGLNQTIPADGGVLVPPAFATTIWDGMRGQEDSLIERCDRYTVSGSSLTLPAVAETSRATGSRWGGVRAYWRAEAAQMQKSKPQFRDLKLEPHELYVFAYVTDKLLRNNPVALEQFLTRAATSEINFLVNDAIVEGDGVGKPLGFLKSPARIVVPKEGAQGADTILAKNIHKMYARLPSWMRAGALWLINQDVQPELDNLSSDSGNVNPIYMAPGGISEAPLGRLKGLPVLPIEWMSTLGDEGDIALVNLRAFALGLTGGIESAMSIHLRFDYSETAFRFTFEADGQSWLADSLTPFKGTTKISPFIVLEAR